MDSLPEGERKAYYRHIENTVFEDSVITSAVRRGRIEGRMEGLNEGRLEAYSEVVLAGYKNGLGIDVLQTLTGLEGDQIEQIIRKKRDLINKIKNR